MSKGIFTYKIIDGLLLLFLLVSLPGYGQRSGHEPLNKSVLNMERRADDLFVKGNYDKAILIYQRVNEKLSPGYQKQKFELKMARLYILLQDPKMAIQYYKVIQNSTADSLLTINDICFYLDALRQTGDAQQAEIVARQYAFRSPYERNQRFRNTLNALSAMRYYYAKGDADYAVEPVFTTSDISEYWLGDFKGVSFYAASQSRVQDPLKIFYHRTKYFSLHENKEAQPLRDIPLELQSGPVAFSDDGKIMIATGINYRGKDRIINIDSDRIMFVTQLYYTVISNDGKRWSRFVPVFEDQGRYCYAHPNFFDNGKSMVFSSDRPGGFGGMDLYFTRWDSIAGQWSEPVNLGGMVNTEGDEIYPVIAGDVLYFSSNGHEGYGGYDIYRVNLGHNAILPGSLFHYPYPMNSTYNDFGAFFEGNKGYFISDRQGMTGRDDIYTFNGMVTPLGNENVVGVSAESSAMVGNLNLMMGLQSSNTGTLVKELSLYNIPAEGELLLSVYFDFNHFKLDAEAIEKLRQFLKHPAIGEIEEFSIIGYADEFGSEKYNKDLSRKRAESVARFLKKEGISAKLSVEGLGKLMLSEEEYLEELHHQDTLNVDVFSRNAEIRKSTDALLFDERVRVNRKVRRVDITVKKKQ